MKTAEVKMKKAAIAAGVALAMGGSSAHAIQILPTDLLWSTLGVGTLVAFTSDSANMTMLDDGGGTVGGTNDVSMMWDGSVFTHSSDYYGPSAGCTPDLLGLGCTISNITASTTTPFFGHLWTAHSIQAFGPGTYSFDATLGGGNPETGTVGGTVGLNQFGVHMLFDWNGNFNIDVFVVANMFDVFGSGVGRSTQATTSGNLCDAGTIQNCLFDGKNFGSAGKPEGDQIWMLASADPDGDGIMGIPMANGGPFAGFNANFNVDVQPTIAPVPVPAAVWLLGSGLLGLLGAARRKKSMS